MTPFDPFSSSMTGQFSATSYPGTRATHDHVVQFYQNENALYATVSTFLAEGVDAGEPCIVIATREHADAFRARLAARGIDVSAALRLGLLIFEDAEGLLARFMEGEQLDAARFKSCISHVLRLAAGTRPNVKLRAFGELVDVLWAQGRQEAALRLEELWNVLAREHSFTLLCGYAVAHFSGSAQTSGFEAVCRQHGRIIHGEPGLRAS